ncbi:hypothetical protein BC938DRAFT_481249 [Jimgerdemannia flammicorona]|uniref:Uncharacterized protein n=1 Tax=Jimgerdemannia flammicorona TaxID=994334 RepID=A0A433QGQ1_9FUNG|nr:hypothetical protein BC938DRAFT_481249 [Jimgerdemannia flammicorona]
MQPPSTNSHNQREHVYTSIGSVTPSSRRAATSPVARSGTFAKPPMFPRPMSSRARSRRRQSRLSDTRTYCTGACAACQDSDIKAWQRCHIYNPSRKRGRDPRRHDGVRQQIHTLPLTTCTYTRQSTRPYIHDLIPSAIRPLTCQLQLRSWIGVRHCIRG